MSKVYLAVMILALTLTLPVAAAQELPRHPPILPPETITPIGTLLVDTRGLARLSSIAYNQSLYVVNITGARYSSLSLVPSLLGNIEENFARGNTATAAQWLGSLKMLLPRLSAGDLRNLAMQVPANMTVCERVIDYDGRPVTVYLLVDSGTHPLQSACESPARTLTLRSPLETIVGLLTFNQSATYDGMYVIALYRIPQAAAMPAILQYLLEGRVGWEAILLAEEGKVTVNRTMIEELIGTIQKGSRDEALGALRTLNDYAKRGLIDWETYGEALRLYRERYGTPILTSTESGNAEMVEVNLTSFLTGLEGIVSEAEKARVEYRNRTLAGGVSIPGIRVPSLTPTALAVAVLGIAVVSAAAERERLKPASTFARIVFAQPPRGAGAAWCYAAMIQVLSLKGYPKRVEETPREYLARLRPSLSPTTLALLEAITEAYESEEYAGRPAALDPRECAKSIRGVLAGGV